MFLDVFPPPEHDSDVRFPLRNLIKAQINLSSLLVQHCMLSTLAVDSYSCSQNRDAIQLSRPNGSECSYKRTCGCKWLSSRASWGDGFKTSSFKLQGLSALSASNEDSAAGLKRTTLVHESAISCSVLKFLDTPYVKTLSVTVLPRSSAFDSLTLILYSN